jgi:hypothetical protein
MTSKTNRSRPQRNHHNHSLTLEAGSFREAVGRVFQARGFGPRDSISQRVLELGIEARRR